MRDLNADRVKLRSAGLCANGMSVLGCDVGLARVEEVTGSRFLALMSRGRVPRAD